MRPGFRTSAEEPDDAGRSENPPASAPPLPSSEADGPDRETAWECGPCRLVRLPSQAADRSGAIVVVVAAPLGLAGRSGERLEAGIADRLARGGREVCRMRWSPPEDGDRGATLDDLVAGHLAEAIRAAGRLRPRAPLGLVGVGAGGVLALCHAALHPAAIGALALVGTAIDYKPEGAVAPVGGSPDPLPPAEFDRFLAAAPLLRRWFEAGDAARPSRFCPDWAAYHGIDWAVPALAEWRARIVGDNGLMRGSLAIDGRPVDPSRIACPILNVFADGAAPASRPLAGLVGAEDYTELPLPEPPGEDDDATAALAAGLAAWFVGRLP